MVDDQTDRVCLSDRHTPQDPKPTQGQHASSSQEHAGSSALFTPLTATTQGQHASSSQEHVGSSALFTPLTAPIIRDIAPAAVAKFLCARERYATINQALQGLQMPMHIMQPEARVQMYFYDFYRRLDEVGCSSFLTENPKKSVKLLLARVEPKILKTEMSSRVFYEPSLEEDVRLFIQALKEEAVACNKYATKSRTTTPPARVTTKSTPVDKTHSNTPDTYLNSDDGICSYSPQKELGVESRISRITDGVSHEDGGDDSSKDERDVEFSDPGPDIGNEWRKAAKERPDEVTSNGISPAGRERLSDLFKVLSSSPRARLDTNPNSDNGT